MLRAKSEARTVRLFSVLLRVQLAAADHVIVGKDGHASLKGLKLF